MKALRRLGVALVVLVVAFGLLVVGARFHDGPLGVIAGGPLDSGEWVETEGLDWSFAADVDTLELQLLNPPRSRTVWVIFHEGALYIACGFMDIRLWKQWPHEAFIDGRGVLRIAGRRYPVELQRSDDEDVRRAVLSKAAQKYEVELGDDDPGAAKSVWVFRVDPRQRGPQG